MSNPLITSKLIWDGIEPRVPDAMLPQCSSRENAREQIEAKGQMRGTALERLGEIASRVCYDSLGTGRPSADFHKNILKVNHLSVYEHCTFTVEWDISLLSTWAAWPLQFLNRPSLFVHMDSGRLRATVNLRHVLEWDKLRVHSGSSDMHECLGEALRFLGHQVAPAIVPPGEPLGVTNRALGASVVAPVLPQEQWITLFMTGSRGWSHELVRHGDWTAISQRSTRYVDENESPWVMHPLLARYLEQAGGMGIGERGGPYMVQDDCKHLYKEIVTNLEADLIRRSIDKFTARKQARGAARGYLGNALLTEVVFSANVAQWKHMLRMRASQAADAEIRESFCKALPELKGSRYGAEFAGFSLAPAPDGIGQVVIEQ